MPYSRDLSEAGGHDPFRRQSLKSVLLPQAVDSENPSTACPLSVFFTTSSASMTSASPSLFRQKPVVSELSRVMASVATPHPGVICSGNFMFRFVKKYLRISRFSPVESMGVQCRKEILPNSRCHCWLQGSAPVVSQGW
jgi:hypothetical protein